MHFHRSLTVHFLNQPTKQDYDIVVTTYNVLASDWRGKYIKKKKAGKKKAATASNDDDNDDDDDDAAAAAAAAAAATGPVGCLGRVLTNSEATHRSAKPSRWKNKTR